MLRGSQFFKAPERRTVQRPLSTPRATCRVGTLRQADFACCWGNCGRCRFDAPAGICLARHLRRARRTTSRRHHAAALAARPNAYRAFAHARAARGRATQDAGVRHQQRERDGGQDAHRAQPLVAAGADRRRACAAHRRRSPSTLASRNISASTRRVGLSEVLAGEATLDETIVRLEPSGLHLLPGGAVARQRGRTALRAEVQRVARRGATHVRLHHHRRAAARHLHRRHRARSAAPTARCSSRVRARRATPRSTGCSNRCPRERILGVVLNGSDEEMNEQNYYYTRKRYIGPRCSGRRDGLSARLTAAWID